MRAFIATALIAASAGCGLPGSSPHPPTGPRPSILPVGDAVSLVNTERRRAGLRELTLDPDLERAAGEYAALMAESGQLTHALGGGFPARARGWGRAAGENIAEGYATPADAVRGWMASPGHRANILGRQYTSTGAGVAVDSRGRKWWCQEFAGASGSKVLQTPGPLRSVR